MQSSPVRQLELHLRPPPSASTSTVHPRSSWQIIQTPSIAHRSMAGGKKKARANSHSKGKGAARGAGASRGASSDEASASDAAAAASSSSSSPMQQAAIETLAYVATEQRDHAMSEQQRGVALVVAGGSAPPVAAAV